MDGQSFAIGGLIKNNVTETISGFPFLSEIPVIGALFRSSEFISDRSELMFLVTPRLVKPLARATSLPTDRFVPPSRSEFMLNGQLEGSSPPPLPATPRAVSPETPAADVVVMPVAESALSSENIDGDRP
jgi:pilus assembly protein CpaC